MSHENRSEIIIYQAEDGQTKIDVLFSDDNVWLPLDKIAKLFARDKSTISRHIKNIFGDGELEQDSVVADFATTAADGKTYQVDYYSLEVIIAVGYRVKSQRGVQFRKWATMILKEYMRKGFALNDDVLKKAGGGDYWRELLNRIRDIRSSEKVLYRQVLDLYATSMDYNHKQSETLKFFKIVQNKLHFAVSGQTAPELISGRVDHKKPFMGLTVFEGTRPRKDEVTIAKNYLHKNELLDLNSMVSAFFDLAEMKARRREPMYMKDWVAELDRFSAMYGKGILKGAGQVTHEAAVQKAETEYEQYRTLVAGELSPVEQAYLDALKGLQKRIGRKGKKTGDGNE
ncbi:MAG: virulence RhuM family protein [Kiritimatiellaeota bacterium]|nr:virulence RhuM family protein [Kiritimatiellota bacterium]